MSVGERLLTRAWKGHLIGTQPVVTDSGLAVRVIYPGRENRDRGPDFVDAIVGGLEGEVVRGDVELHSTASDWRRHGHDRDSHYEDVILQVVWQGDGEAVARNGRRIPTLRLSDVLECSPDGLRRRIELLRPPVDACGDAIDRLGESEIGRLLDEAGEERFTIKARAFAARMGDESPSEVLYQGVMRGLGYAKNAAAFEDMARRLPLSTLERACRGRPFPPRVEVLRALLLGKAGLLSRSVDDRAWRIWRREGDGEPMPASCWRLFRVRPENHPARRLAGAAHLVAGLVETGLLEGVVDRVAAAADTETLERVLTVGPASDGERCLVGKGRAREIVINIVLPFARAWAEANERPQLALKALALYRSCPKAGEYGATRRLGRLLAGDRISRIATTARRQQGLVHVDGMFCRPRECAICPFGR